MLGNIVLHAGILHNAENPATDSDRGKDPVSRCRLHGFWGRGKGQKHSMANQAGAEGMDRLTLTASQKTNEEVKAPNVDHAKKWNKEFSSLEKQIVSLIAYIAPRGKIHKEIMKVADDIKITYSRLKRLDSGLLEMTTAPMKTNEQQITPSCVQDTGVPKVQAQGGEANGTPIKRKEILTLQPEGRKRRRIKSRKEKPE